MWFKLKNYAVITVSCFAPVSRFVPPHPIALNANIQSPSCISVCLEYADFATTRNSSDPVSFTDALIPYQPDASKIATMSCRMD